MKITQMRTGNGYSFRAFLLLWTSCSTFLPMKTSHFVPFLWASLHSLEGMGPSSWIGQLDLQIYLVKLLFFNSSDSSSNHSRTTWHKILHCQTFISFLSICFLDSRIQIWNFYLWHRRVMKMQISIKGIRMWIPGLSLTSSINSDIETFFLIYKMKNINEIWLGGENFKRKYTLMLLSAKNHFYFPFVSTSLCTVKIVLTADKAKPELY